MTQDLSTLPRFEPYWRMDRGDPPKFLLERSTHDLGNEPIPKDVFISAEFHALEVERLWKKVWQMACRENDIPQAGDQLVYDIADQSVVILRDTTGAIRAYHNVCRHRGNRLVDGFANSPRLQCSFHGWTWDLDGRLASVPCRWDFPQLCEDQAALAEVKVRTWNGWVFVNLDPEAGPLEAFLGPEIPAQFERWPAQRAQKVGHVAKVVPCNWKLALQAFLEAYHVVGTHPQILPYYADCNAQYDFYGPHARFVSAFGAPSPHIGDLDDQAVVDAMLGDAFANLFGEGAGDHEIPVLQRGQKARHFLADFMKQALGQQSGLDFSGISDVEVLDGIEYFLFPNFVAWGGFAFPIAYRARPNGDDPASSIFEIMVLARLPEGADLPPDIPLRMTDPDEPWSAAPEMAGLGRIMDQDAANLAKLQRGIRSDGVRELQFANYQERTLRNFHNYLDQYVRG